MIFEQAKIALVFDWMTTMGGAEKVNLELHKIFPNAPIFSSIFNKKKIKGFENAKITTSYIQNLPFSKTKHQLYLNFMPYAYELFDLREFDIVISSSHSCAKGIITKPETMHICYCHSPMRYAWDDWQSYIKNYNINWIIKKIGKKSMHKLRMWDKISADRVDYFIANSNTTKQRIAKYYKRQSSVIHPMIECAEYKLTEKKGTYFLAAGRLTPYKKFDLIIETFNILGLPLKIAGTGTQEKHLKKLAKKNIEFLGFVPENELRRLYRECEALIFPQLEDFGITAIEAMASGRPVIAYKKGGALDSIKESETGIFFEKQDTIHLKTAIEKYQNIKNTFDPEKIREHSKQFDTSQFRKQIIEYINEKWEKWSERKI